MHNTAVGHQTKQELESTERVQTSAWQPSQVSFHADVTLNHGGAITIVDFQYGGFDIEL